MGFAATEFVKLLRNEAEVSCSGRTKEHRTRSTCSGFIRAQNRKYRRLRLKHHHLPVLPLDTVAAFLGDFH